MKNPSLFEPKNPDPPDVLGRYCFLPWTTRFFLWARWNWTPYREMAALLPTEGKIFDGGCGHGLLSLALALSEPTRKIIGVDHSERRVGVSTIAASGLSNVVFKMGDYSAISWEIYDGMALIDVLHYLPHGKQDEILRSCFTYLRPGGIFLFREVDPSSGFASRFNRVHEKIMTGLGFTRAHGLYFRKPGEWKAVAEQAGFRVLARPFTRFPFADVLFECRKP